MAVALLLLLLQLLPLLLLLLHLLLLHLLLLHLLLLHALLLLLLHLLLEREDLRLFPLELRLKNPRRARGRSDLDGRRVRSRSESSRRQDGGGRLVLLLDITV